MDVEVEDRCEVVGVPLSGVSNDLAREPNVAINIDKELKYQKRVSKDPRLEPRPDGKK